jgi:hypothetical protein
MMDEPIRETIRDTNVILVMVVILGCFGCSHQYAHVASETGHKRQSWTVDMPYQATCRLLLQPIRQEWGENRVKLEVWTDIEEASIYPSWVATRGVDCIVIIHGDGPSKCTVNASGTNVFQTRKVCRLIEKVLEETKGAGE